MAWWGCYWRNRHEPMRHPLGGFRCADCGFASESLDEMGFPDAGWVRPVRKIYARDGRGGGELTRTSEWSPGRKGW